MGVDIIPWAHIIPGTITDADSSQPTGPTSSTDHDSSLKEVTFHNLDEINSVVVKTLVSDHIVQAVDKYCLRGITGEGIRKKRH